jgi:hypothetical protein
MEAPQEFVRRLHEESGGDLRIRWSNKRDEWHIEQKVARATLVDCPVSEDDDELIRARDGSVFVLAVRTGDRMPCPLCGIELHVPTHQFGEVRCEYCRMMRRDGRYVAGHFPLGDALLQHLRRLDPKRGWRDGEKERLDARNKRLQAVRERDYSNHIEATTKENFRDLFSIGQWGYNSPAHPKGH